MTKNTLLIAILICLARIIDVSVGTMRLKSIMRGNKPLAMVLAFTEVMVYTIAASSAFEHVNKPHILIMYSLGYAFGNYIGIVIDDKLTKDKAMALIIKEYDDWLLADELRGMGYRVTTNIGYGMGKSKKAELKVVVPKGDIEFLKRCVTEHDDTAYIVILDVKGVNRMAVRK